MTAGGVRFYLQCKGGCVLNENRLRFHRVNYCPGGITSVAYSLASSAISNGFLRRQISPSTGVRRGRLSTISALDTGSTPGGDGRGPFGLGTTRLKRIIQNGSKTILSRFNRTRRNFPTKIFLLLLGYYSANALATVLGQTGDWDVLAAGILVSLIEGVGYLMYRMPSFLGPRGKELVVYVNYYKSGMTFGLFADAFKLGS